MRLSENQLDRLQQAARFPQGRAAARGSAIRGEVLAAGADPERAMENVIRAAHDTGPPAPVSPVEVLEPAAPEILSPGSTTTLVVQVAPITPRRRSRISAAVALLMLAFGAGTAMSWLLFGEPLRARDQVWNLVPLALQTAKGSLDQPAAPSGPAPNETGDGAASRAPAVDAPRPRLRSTAIEAPAPESLAACLAGRPASLRLAREETARLLKRGEEFMAGGQVSAARLMFQRAAEACDVRAAFALGASYDPIMLQKLGVALLDPNVQAARSWYERAKELGSSEASQELELLSNWHP